MEANGLRIIGNRPIDVPLAFVRPPSAAIGQRIAWVVAKDFTVLEDGISKVPLAGVRVPAVETGQYLVGIQRQHAGEIGKRPISVLLLQVSLASSKIAPGGIRLQLDGSGIIRDGLVTRAKLRISLSPVAECRGVVRLQ